MDTSKEYILMCQRAEEIQDNHKWDKEDLIIVLTYSWVNTEENTRVRVQDDRYYYSGVYFGVEHSSSFMTDKDRTKSLWLPRQDQLQEMIDWDKRGSYKTSMKVQAINEFYGSEWEIAIDGVDITMEQLWLAFVMKEKYNKKWDGKEWTPVK